MDSYDNIDEKIIDLMNAVEDEQNEKEEKVREEEKPNEIIIQGHRYELKEWLLFDNKLKILAPENFKIMDEKFAKAKFPSENRPGFILTDASTTINITVTEIDQKVMDEDLEGARDNMITMMTRLNPGITVLEKDTFEENSKKFAYFRFGINVLDGRLVNLMVFLTVDDMLKLINFSCSSKSIKYWKDPFIKFMKGIEITKESEK